jgi:hypothetical protein
MVDQSGNIKIEKFFQTLEENIEPKHYGGKRINNLSVELGRRNRSNLVKLSHIKLDSRLNISADQTDKVLCSASSKGSLSKEAKGVDLLGVMN